MKLVFNAMIYYIWRLATRIFNGKSMAAKALVNYVISDVRMKLVAAKYSIIARHEREVMMNGRGIAIGENSHTQDSKLNKTDIIFWAL